MNFFSHDEGRARVFSLKGRLELGVYPDSRLILEALASKNVDEVVIDLSDLEFIDSAGVGLLIGLNKTASETGKPMVLRGASGTVKELIDLFQLNTIFEVR